MKPQMLSLRVLLIQFFIPFREIVGAIGMTEPGMTSFSPTSYIVLLYKKVFPWGMEKVTGVGSKVF